MDPLSTSSYLTNPRSCVNGFSAVELNLSVPAPQNSGIRASLRAEQPHQSNAHSRGECNKGRCMAWELSSTQGCYDNDMSNSAVLPRWSTQGRGRNRIPNQEVETTDQGSATVFVNLHLCSEGLDHRDFDHEAGFRNLKEAGDEGRIIVGMTIRFVSHEGERK
ncbi:hypothetical protein DL546_005401 [Coniochaeta pulveracea]|uniref:Uncharacterized protein n=1 Tax=Coniochaeta pulveracea TaxID=177199 RepID=A0A420Y1V4_9PEZI|nr:hypothetical protein DL546_005401 [Coniochaeta pulveracea]